MPSAQPSRMWTMVRANLALIALSGFVAVWVSGAGAVQAPERDAHASERARLLALHREATGLLRAAARAEAAAEDVRAALADASERMAALASGV